MSLNKKKITKKITVADAAIHLLSYLVDNEGTRQTFKNTIA